MGQDHTRASWLSLGARRRGNLSCTALRSAASALRLTAASDRNRSRPTISADFTGHGIGKVLGPSWSAARRARRCGKAKEMQ
jgi:hypothetical protein